MTLAPYRQALALPGVVRLLAFAVLARLPQTASSIILTLHVVEDLGRGWAAAGLVGASATVGMAIGGPWRGRLVDRYGLRRALAPSVVAEALVWGSAPWLPYHWLLGAAFVGGLLGLPIFTVVRQSLSILAPPERRRSVFALDSMGVELSFIAGPTIGVLVATQWSTTAGLLGVGLLMVTSGLALMAFNPPTRTADSVRDDDGVRVPRSQWFSARLVAILACTSASVFVLAGTDVSIVAHLREDDAVTLAGVVFLAWGAGSMVGGLVYGALHRPVQPFHLLLALAVLTAPVGLAPSWWTLALAILPAALLCAPVLTATAEQISGMVPEGSRGEAMGWHGSSLTLGGAMGAPLAGSFIDAEGAWAGFAIVGGVGALLAVAGLLVDLRVRSRRRAAEYVEAA